MFVSENPDYLNDWDWEKNTDQGISPDALTVGSRQRVFWICHICGGRWDTVMKERRGCPYCSGIKALAGYNDLATTHPELAKQWSYKNNGELRPQDVTKGSQKKVFWLCNQGHVWDAQINSRVAGQGCPYCNNRRVLCGYNDLATIRPDLVKDWNTEKNGALTPFNVTAGSKKYVWWKCGLGHEWRAQIVQRNKGTGCPVCANRVVAIHHNDFASEHPELLNEWDYDKNEKLPAEYTSGSMKSVWWVCKRGHSWKTAIVYRCKGSHCPKCSEERRVSFPEKAVYYYLRQVFPEIQANYRDVWSSPYELDMYLAGLNVAIEYDGVYGHSNLDGVARDIRKNKMCADNGVTLIRIRENKCPPTNSSSIDFILDEKNSLEPAINFALSEIWKIYGKLNTVCPFPDINIARDAGDIYSLIEYSEKENSLQAKAPQIAAMWHPEKNGMLTPADVSSMSSKVVWWRGICGHEWRSSIAFEINSGLCPYCSGKRILIGFNDLQSVNPTLAQEWDYEKNIPLTPVEVTAGSGKRVWWKCKRGHAWRATIVSRSRGNGCPICANRVVQRGYNDVASIPNLLADWDHCKNNLEPTEACIGSEKKAWWSCHTCGYKWSAVVRDRYQGQGCPQCAEMQRRISAANTYVKKNGSLLEKRPDLIAEWDWEKNGDLQPSQVTCGSTKKANWICRDCGHKWKASISSRCRQIGGGCPNCADKKRAQKRRETLLRKKASLTETHPSIADEWCHDKNGELKPELFTSGSGKKVWWHCAQCGAEWAAAICERTRGRGKCPRCNKCGPFKKVGLNG